MIAYIRFACAIACIAFVLVPSATNAARTISIVDLLELEVGYDTLAQQYYGRVTPQQLADGAYTGIASYLTGARVPDPRVGPIHAAKNDALGPIDRAVALAVERYGDRITTRELIYATIAGEAASVHDEYTVFFSPPQYRAFNNYLQPQRSNGAPSATVDSKMARSGIGYLKVRVFGLTTPDELRRAISTLGAAARAYVVDLRGNGGGYRDSAVGVARIFVASGPIVTVEERHGHRTTFSGNGTAIARKPLVVLIDRGTASASEIVAAALHDDGLATLLGERTYGKGLVQSVFPLPDGSALKVTTGRYVTAGGRDVEGIGIAPDVTVPATGSGDPQLDRALTLLNGTDSRTQ